MCGEVVVLKLSGWQESIGVQAEIAAARALGKPVTFLEPEDDTTPVAAGPSINREAVGETSGPPESATI